MANKTAKKSNAIHSILLIVVALLICSLVAGIMIALLRKDDESAIKNETYTASASTYKDLQKFAYFADENGKKVSSENPYTYEAESEKELVAVYEDFVDVTIQVNTSGASAWYAENKKYKSENWFDLGYLTEPLTQGMSVSFEFYTSGMALFGVSPLERIENSVNYGWGTSYPNLFVPEINYYSSTEDTSFELYQLTSSAHGGKTPYKFASLKTGYHTAKIVMADKVLIYIDNVLTNGEGKEYDTSKPYYLSLSGSGPSYQFTEFGMDKDSKQEIVSTPLEESYFSGKKITFLGDSITAGVGSNFSTSERYATVLSNELSAVENNMGISGTVLCTGHESRASRLGDIDKIALDSDYVFVMLGTNDFDNAKAGFAELGKKGSTDTSTVYGAMNVLCQKLASRFDETDTKIYLVTPIPVLASLDSTQECANGWSLRDWSEALIETTKEYGLNYIDMNLECEFEASDMDNSLHPSTAGTTKMVAVLKAHLLANETYYIPYEI